MKKTYLQLCVDLIKEEYLESQRKLTADPTNNRLAGICNGLAYALGVVTGARDAEAKDKE